MSQFTNDVTSDVLALDTSVTGLQVSQGSTTSGEKGSLIQGAVTTAAPAYTTGQTSPLSLDTSGNLRVTFAAAGEQNVNLNQVGGVAISLGQTTMASSLPITIASNQSRLNTSDLADGSTGSAVPATAILSGANVVSSAPTLVAGNLGALYLTTAGRLVVDGSQVTQPVSGTVTANAGTGNFTVVQPTGTNLHTVVDSGSITVTQATAANLNATVVGTVTANPPVSSSATITRVATSTTAATALAANASRKQAIITTELGNTYVAFGSTATTTNYTYLLTPSSVLEVPTSWTGSISVIRSSASGSIQVTEIA